MNDNFINTIFLALAFLVLFISSELMYHKLGVKAENTRKYVHVVTGVLAMLFPQLIGDHWLILLLCGSFFILLSISLVAQLMPSINAVDRVTRGSLLYPVIVYGCYLAFQRYDEYVFYYTPILVLAFCDPMAAIVGMRWPIKKYDVFGHTKSMSGSTAFFVSALSICWVLIFLEESVSIQTAFIVSLAVALITTIAEALSHKGYDNLTIPASAIITLYILKEHYLLW